MRPLLLLVVLLAAAACAATPVRHEPPPGPDAIYGFWALADGSTTVMRIDRGGASGGVAVDAWTTDSEVHFDVSAVAWDGRRLHATFRYPPSDVTTTSDLVLVNADRLEGTVKGPYQARETWLRTEAVTPPPSGS